jgi:alkanesulfonate monooxygenase SsuD/methylene tetrahydromethanopterin reductase-like flavin-dependent oxidoreductase (luciferase family)
MYCNEDADLAQSRMYEYLGNFWNQNVEHYEFLGSHFATQKGYERYAEKADALREKGVEQAGRDYADAALYGTPEQLIAKLEWIQDIMGQYELIVAPCFGGMPQAMAEESLRLFAEKVAPVVREKYDVRIFDGQLAR